MSELVWHQRLHWRGFLTFTVLLVAIEIPIWLIAESTDASDPERASARALGMATIGALLAGALTMIAARYFLAARFGVARRLLHEALTGDQRTSAVRDEIVDFAADADERVRTMHSSMVRLEQEKGRLSALLEGMGEAVLMVDDSERIIVANRVAERLLRLPDQYEGKRLADVCDTQSVCDVTAEVLWSHEPATDEVDFERKDELRHISISASPIMAGDSSFGAVVLLTDVTRLRRLERVRRDFVANVSHELRTPIAAVRSAAETLTLADLEVDPVTLDFLQTIERNAVRMGEIVEDLLTLSRLEAAGEEIQLSEVDLPAIFAEVFDRSEPIARRSGVDFVLDVDEDLPTVFAEPGALRQVLQNLAENAIKYTPKDGTVLITAEQKGRKRVRVEVSDTGVGIPPDHLPRIFERFYRVDVGRSREIGGTGLGLAIAKHLVRKLKGRISVESEEGEGTKFTLWLRTFRPEKAE